MLAFKGIDNRLLLPPVPDDARYYMDYTGTGNSLNPAHPSVLRLIMDSLRYFVIECHVDGFRFDLASALAASCTRSTGSPPFFDIIHQDPVLSQVKLIAEPWDVGQGGYQVGNFPVLWTEWNGMYRDTIRDFWRSQAPSATSPPASPARATCTPTDGRRPFASINFLTAHDGFTLRDLVSYNDKHNEANGEEQPRRTERQPLVEPRGRGRPDDPRDRRAAAAPGATSSSRCCSLAGRADAPRRRRDRAHPARQQQRLVPGQRALVVRLGRVHEELLAFAKRLIGLRHEHPRVPPAQRFLEGRERMGSGAPDV